MKRENGKRTHFLADTVLTTFPWELAPMVVRSGGSTPWRAARAVL